MPTERLQKCRVPRSLYCVSKQRYSRLTNWVWRRTIGKRELSGFSSVPCDSDCAMEMARWQGMVLKIRAIGHLPTTSIRQTMTAGATVKVSRMPR